jgi:flagellar L-ring protein precursor FlgH
MMKKLIGVIFCFIMCITFVFGETQNIRLALNMYSNQRAHSVGDLVTIVVKEATSSNKKEDHSTSKSVSADANSPFIGTPMDGTAMTAIRNALISGAKKNMPIAEYKIAGTSSSSGSGSTSSEESLIVTFTARVVDVLPNGVLVIRGDRKVIIRNESVNLVMTGLVRTRDIDNDNIVASTRVADAHIYYETSGEISRGSRPGYFWRIFQYLNPF